MKKYPDFISVLIGSKGAGFFFGYVTIAFICALAIIFWDIANRDPKSQSSPFKFYLRYWLADNLFRIMANFILIPIAIRMIYEYADPVWMLAISAGIGFGFDALGLIAKRAGILTTSKLAERMNQKLSQ
jgi:hypothetical protein